MKRTLTLLVALTLGTFTLGCGGIMEAALEAGGLEMEMGENGEFSMTLPDGTKLVTTPNGSPPEGFPLPDPWPDAKAESVVTQTSPEGKVTHIVTWRLEKPKAEVVAVYDAWFEGKGLEVKHEKSGAAGVVSEVWMSALDDGQVLVTVSEAYGQNTVSAIWVPQGEYIPNGG